METFKRISASLKSQIKDFGGLGVTSGGSSSNQHSNSIQNGYDDGTIPYLYGLLFQSKLHQSGEIVFDSNGPFHNFVTQIEETVISVLLNEFNPEDMTQASSVFITCAAHVSSSEFDLDTFYSVSPIGAIRMSIRLIAMSCPHRLFENLKEIFGSIIECRGSIDGISLDKPSFLESDSFIHLKDEMSALLLKSPPINRNRLHSSMSTLTFQMLLDEPYLDIYHPDVIKDMTRKAPNINSILLLNSIRITVEMSGCEEIHGLYELINTTALMNNTQSNPIYRRIDDTNEISSENNNRSSHYKTNSITSGSSSCSSSTNGNFMITRILKSLKVNDSKLSSIPEYNADIANTVSSSYSCHIVYIWTISNPILDTEYYTCPTLKDILTPPSVGWSSSVGTGVSNGINGIINLANNTVNNTNLTATNKVDNVNSHNKGRLWPSTRTTVGRLPGPRLKVSFVPLSSVVEEGYVDGEVTDMNGELKTASECLVKLNASSSSSSSSSSIVFPPIIISSDSRQRNNVKNKKDPDINVNVYNKNNSQYNVKDSLFQESSTDKLFDSIENENEEINQLQDQILKDQVIYKKLNNSIVRYKRKATILTLPNLKYINNNEDYFEVLSKDLVLESNTDNMNVIITTDVLQKGKNIMSTYLYNSSNKDQNVISDKIADINIIHKDNEVSGIDASDLYEKYRNIESKLNEKVCV